MNIVGIAGKKQSGKNTTANILHGMILKEQGLVADCNIDGTGKLIIFTSNSDGREDWGEFDITRKDNAFIEYAEHNMWPYVKLYSFADNLKQICVDLFSVPPECVWGTDKQKSQLQEHLLWENMPKAINSTMMKKIIKAPDVKRSFDWKEGPMTAREFMQFLGTDVMRKMYEPVWVQSCVNKIKREQPSLAIVADVRFPNEVDAITDAGGVVVRLTRGDRADAHPSETALDDYDFSHHIDNTGSVDALIDQVKLFYKNL